MGLALFMTATLQIEISVTAHYQTGSKRSEKRKAVEFHRFLVLHF